MSVNMQDRYIATMLLHAVGDTVGFKNGEWEFKKGGIEKTLEKLYEFIDLGGVNHINLSDWSVSDDTIMHLKTAESILKDHSNMGTLCTDLTKNYVVAYEFMKTGAKRFPGSALMKYLEKLSKGMKCYETPYDDQAGGSGASIRTPCVGLVFYNDINKLIEISIETSRITHNNAVGYLGGLASALFVSYAIRNISINKWPYKLMKLFDKGVIDAYIKKTGRDYAKYERDAHIFIEKWKRYIDNKFNDKKVAIRRKSSINLLYRNKYYNESFAYLENGKRSEFIGSGGDDSVILAYDCLLDAGKNWEKIVIYSMLHMGDTDTTGCLAGAFYGSLYGFQDVPKNFYEHIEFKDQIVSIGTKLYEKFYKAG